MADRRSFDLWQSPHFLRLLKREAAPLCTAGPLPSTVLVALSKIPIRFTNLDQAATRSSTSSRPRQHIMRVAVVLTAALAPVALAQVHRSAPIRALDYLFLTSHTGRQRRSVCRRDCHWRSGICLRHCHWRSGIYLRNCHGRSCVRVPDRYRRWRVRLRRSHLGCGQW